MADRGPRLDLLTPEERAYVCAELCNHLVAARQFDRLDDLLVNLDYLAQRCGYDGVDGVLRDFDTARSARPRPWAQDAPQSEFSRFFSRSSHLLRLAPALIWQEARNWPGPAIAAAARAHREPVPATPALRRLTQAVPDQHTGRVVSLAFTGSDLLVSTTAPEVWAWDRETGRVRARFQAPPAPARSLTVSPDGRFVAACFGSAYPSSDIAGVQVWTRDGGVRSSRRLRDWVYTVRWRGPAELVAGGGIPLGGGPGRIWRVDAVTGECDEVASVPSGQPIVLTWDPVPSDPGQLMALAQDGVVLWLRPGSQPVTVAGTIAAPITTMDGFCRAADTFRHSENMLCLLGQSLPVPPGMPFADQIPADGIYVLDMAARSYGVIDVPQAGKDAGYRMLCIAASPADKQVVVGDAHGGATLMRVDSTATRTIHRGQGSVTAVCFDDSGRLLAVGDSESRVVVYDVASGDVRMRTPRPDRAVAAGSGLVLFAGRLEIDGAAALALADGQTAVDFARCGELAVVLCRQEGKPDVLAVADLEQHEWLFDLPAPAVPGLRSPGTGPPPAFRRVELSNDADGCHVHLSSVAGVCSGLLLAPDTCTFLTLPDEVTHRLKSMSAIRVDREPGLVCGLFAPVAGGMLCAYTDNGGYPAITGELHLLGSRHAEVMSFASAITALATGPDLVVVGTSDGQSAALHRSGDTWERLCAIDHPATVMAAAVTTELACTASSDGLIIVWRVRDGTRVLMASADIEPIAVTLTDTQVRVVDAAGRQHAWQIENFTITERPAPPVSMARYLDALRTITVAAQLAILGDVQMAGELLNDLPQLPERGRIRKIWSEMYRLLAEGGGRGLPQVLHLNIGGVHVVEPVVVHDLVIPGRPGDHDMVIGSA